MNSIYNLKDYFILDKSNPWEGTPLENYYALNPAAKGNKAEEIVSSILTSMGYDVKDRTDSGHDRIINGIKTEIKFATAVNRNTDWGCMYNHISFEKDWDQILLVCVNGDCLIHGILYKKEKLPKELLAHQQGGKRSDNDDFMVEATKSKAILFNKNGTTVL